MKKVLVILFSMMFSLSFVTLAGCGDSSEGDASLANSPYVGVWEAVAAEFNDEPVDLNEILEGEDFIIDLQEDGTASVDAAQDGHSEATWTVSGDKVKVTGDEINLKFKDRDGKLVANILGVKLIFAKQNADGTVEETEPMTEAETEAATDDIGVDKATEIALNDAGFSADEVQFTQQHAEIDDGVNIYEIDFVNGDTEYDYDIDAKTGDILERGTDSVYDD